MTVCLSGCHTTTVANAVVLYFHWDSLYVIGVLTLSVCLSM